MVSIKTTKESNTITVLTESEATNRALLGIKEIQITEQQPLPVQAYEVVGEPASSPSRDPTSLGPFGTGEMSWKYIHTGPGL
ncbi:unnamed protein product [Ixodes hexagonus]